MFGLLCPRAEWATLGLWLLAPSLANGFALRAPPDKQAKAHLAADSTAVVWRTPAHWNGSGFLRAVYEDNQSADWLTEAMFSPVQFTMILCNNMKPAGTLVSGYVGCMPHSRGCFMSSPIQSPSCSMGLMYVNRLMEDHYDSMRVNFTHLNSSRWQAEWGELVSEEDTVASTGLPLKLPKKLVYVAILDGTDENDTRISFHDGCNAGRRALGLQAGGSEGEGALSFACSQASLEVWRSCAARGWVNAVVALLFGACALASSRLF